MKRLLNVLILATVIVLYGFAGFLPAQDTKKTKPSGEKKQAETSRVDLKTQTLVGKKLAKVENGANGKKVYHYTYRVQAKATEKEMPRYTVDPQYNVSYKQEGFQEGDSVTLVSTNGESATDSPIWVYDVAYTGSGTRSLTFETSGSMMVASFAAANAETDPDDPSCHCKTCRHYDASLCTPACRCCCTTDDAYCNCLGCQLQQPRCFSCPEGCRCDHCICSCDGCMTSKPRCLACPVGCTCDHCRCQCEASIDHLGRCGCAACRHSASTCECECHNSCP